MADLPKGPNQPSIKQPWAQTPHSVFKQLDSNPAGLSTKEAELRLTQYGQNALPENDEKTTWWGTVKETFAEKLPLMLLVSAIISAILGLLMKEPDRFKDFMSLSVILLSMAIANYLMGKNTDKGLASLKKTLQKAIRVYRDGIIIKLPVTQLVVGDVIFLSEGDLIPADGRIIEATNASVNEAVLTGESDAVDKSVVQISHEAELARRSNMIFMNTFVSSGTIVAVLTATALQTEMGKIATEIEKAEETKTPLQKQLDVLGIVLLNATLVVCALVAAFFLWRAYPIFVATYQYIQAHGLAASGAQIAESLTVIADIFTVSVSLAIAFIPEALSAVIILALAIGVAEMVKEGAIVKNPKGAEALGSVTIFNSDKTGTLTKGEMAIVSFWTPKNGDVSAETVLNGNGQFAAMKEVMAFCNDLHDATERALAEFVASAGFIIGEATIKDRKLTIPFTSTRKRMSVIFGNGTLKMLTKGAPEVVLELCSDLQGESLESIQFIVDSLSDEGYRVLALAERNAESVSDVSESGLTFLGLVALMDPPRPEVVETIATIKIAGVTPVMITGDNGRTAQTIARQVGILDSDSKEDQLMSGQQLNSAIGNRAFEKVEDIKKMVSAKVLEQIANVRVFYRVSPTDKKIIVMCQQALGNIVAMTGDGVNDAPALKQADIGVAMGDRATEVTKDVSDMILTKGYAAIAPAIRVGRTILMRTRLYTHALLSTNMSEVGIFIYAAVVGWLPPLTSVMLLVINFLGDGWLSIALATEPSEKDVMTQKPRPSTEAVITPYMWTSIALQGVLVTIILAYVFNFAGVYANNLGLEGTNALKFQQSLTFAAFLVQKVARSSFTARSLKYNIWEFGFFTNKWTLLAGFTTAVMGISFLEIGPLSNFLGMVSIPAGLWPMILGLGMIPPVLEEVVKFVRRK